MSEKKKTQLDMFGNHKEIEVDKDLSKQVPKKSPNKYSKENFIVDYDEAVEAIKKSYKSFLKVDPSIRAKIEIKDLAFQTAWDQETDNWNRQYFLLDKEPRSTRYIRSQGLNDDEYLTLKIAKVTNDNVSYMGNLSNRLKNDSKFFKQLYKVRPYSYRWDYLEYAGSKVIADRDIIEIAVKASSSEFKYIDSGLKTDLSFLAMLYRIDNSVIEYFDRSTMENTAFLDELPTKLQRKVISHSDIKAAQGAARYQSVKRELENFILSYDPKKMADVLRIFAALNISFDYKFNKSLGSPELSKQIEIKTDLPSLLKEHFKTIDYELNRDTNYEDLDLEIDEWEGDEFTEFEQELIEIVNQGNAIPEKYFLDENAAPLGDSFDQENIGSRAVILDAVDEENCMLGFYAAYRDKAIFLKHASCFIHSDVDFNPNKILDKYSNALKNVSSDISIINSYILRLRGKKFRWYQCIELDQISEKLPELLWDILDSLYDETYYCNNFGTLAKVLGANGPDMWESSIHCLACKKGKTIDFMTSCISL
tara:strand:- start:240 stop:1847 length:1608 start_codon:yes stop_codon:yes gene_type:complete